MFQYIASHVVRSTNCSDWLTKEWAIVLGVDDSANTEFSLS